MLALFLSAAPAHAQSPAGPATAPAPPQAPAPSPAPATGPAPLGTVMPPGPYVIDVRGAMSGVPTTTAFFPTLPVTTTPVPSRAFGLDLGAHVYPKKVGAGQLGIGANVILARGSVSPPEVSARVTAIAPQVSLNFGGSNGWSSIGVGYGVARVSTRVGATTASTGSTTSSTGTSTSGTTAATAAATAGGELSTGLVGDLNIGGGARWFTGDHVGVAFDIRIHRLGASSAAGTPGSTMVILSAGFSLR